jgi:uncharacterized protein YciI
MLFAIHALDVDNSAPLRARAQADHKAHLGKAGDYGVRIVTSGPLVSDDGAAMCGSLIVVEAAGRADVETFNRADPYQAAGVWKTVSITAWNRLVMG